MRTKRRLENLEMIVSQLNLKIFGTDVYLNRPISERLDEVCIGHDVLHHRFDVLESEVADLAEDMYSDDDEDPEST